MMMFKSVLMLLLVGLAYGIVRYDYFTGQPASEEQLAFYSEMDVVDVCTVAIEPCKENERKRVDGTCNNPDFPSRGGTSDPQPRLLPAVFFNGSYARKAVSGNDLPLPRVVRVKVLGETKSIHKDLTQNVPGYGIFMFMDIGVPHDIQNFLSKTTNCCQKEHMNDYACTPNIIPEDDPIHCSTGIRCMNSTRPLTFQSFYCTNNSTPSPYAKASSAFDLSQIYNARYRGDKVIRSFEGGLLATEEENDMTWPPTGPTASCLLNQPDETRCFKNYMNGLLSIGIFTVWYVRNHNFIASNLAAVNPCWNDETLFHYARDINMAFSQQVYLYEWMAAVVGRKNLEKAGVLSKKGGFRDLYDKKLHPVITMEYTFVMRWFHVFQDSTLRMYDKTGNYVKDFPLNNLTFRTGFLAKDRNMEYATQSSFRQACHDRDGVDYEMAEHGLPGVQRSLDITAGDINKGRHFGIAPYVDYVYLFSGNNISCFEDLEDIMPESYIRKLVQIYEDVADVDLLVGLWGENLMKCARIPYTLASILVDQMLRTMKGDRHWYERPNRPFAFTKAQLKEIRKATLSLLLCSVGDGVTEIQKNAFLTISDDNPIVSCDEIPKIDFNAWADPQCSFKCQEAEQQIVSDEKIGIQILL